MNQACLLQCLRFVMLAHHFGFRRLWGQQVAAAQVSCIEQVELLLSHCSAAGDLEPLKLHCSLICPLSAGHSLQLQQ